MLTGSATPFTSWRRSKNLASCKGERLIECYGDFASTPNSFSVASSMQIARRTTLLCISLSLSLTSAAQQNPSPLSPYVKEDAPVLVLEHVRPFMGTNPSFQAEITPRPRNC